MRRRRSVFAGAAVLLLTVAIAVPAWTGAAEYTDPTPAQVAAYIARNADTPYQGWSSWSLQATTAPGVNPRGPASWLTAGHVLAQGRAMAATLRSHGYDYVNIDDGWSSTWQSVHEFDAFGRPAVDAARFPDGMAALVRTLHALGLKVGLYLPVGLEKGAYDNGDFPVLGAPGCSTHDLVYADLRPTNGWNSSYAMNFANPCSQYYLDSIAKEFASWGVDFLKLDGVGPSSSTHQPFHDNTADVQAWATALAGSGRRIHLELSWALSHADVSTWQRWSNGWRVDNDVECYCSTLTSWKRSVVTRFSDVLAWTDDAAAGHWNDLDSLDVGDGARDGLTRAERQTATTLWAIEDSPLFTGDDLTALDAYGRQLLTNDEVIAIDQAGAPARPVSTTAPQQVWTARLRDGSSVVALLNLAATPATVTADLGGTAAAPVVARDVWNHTSSTVTTRTLTRALPAHGSALFRVSPSAH